MPISKSLPTLNKPLSAILLLGASLALSGCFLNNDPSASWSTSVQGVYSAQFSLDGSHAAVGSVLHGGSLWRTEDGERLFNWNHKADSVSAITALAFSSDSGFAVTVDETTVVLWDVAKGTALRYFNAPGEIRFIELTPGAEKALLGMDSGRVVLFNIRRGGIIHELEQDAGIVSHAISGNGRYALFGLDNKKVQLWDLTTASVIQEMNTNGRVHTMALSEDGEQAFMAIQHQEAGIWDMKTGLKQKNLKYSNVFFPTFSSFLVGRFYADGKQLLTGNTTGAMELWDTETGDRLERWITPRSTGFGPTNFSVVTVAKHHSQQQVLAMTSNGTSYQFQLNPD